MGVILIPAGIEEHSVSTPQPTILLSPLAAVTTSLEGREVVKHAAQATEPTGTQGIANLSWWQGGKASGNQG